MSWDEIHNVLWEAHEDNRSKGVVMDNNSLPGDKIRDRIGKDGKLFVALDDDKVVGTLALKKRQERNGIVLEIMDTYVLELY